MKKKKNLKGSRSPEVKKDLIEQKFDSIHTTLAQVEYRLRELEETIRGNAKQIADIKSEREIEAERNKVDDEERSCKDCSHFVIYKWLVTGEKLQARCHYYGHISLPLEGKCEITYCNRYKKDNKEE